MSRLRVAPTDIRHPSRRHERRDAARRGWWNWYVDRGRFLGGASPHPRELRMVSHRRAL